MVNDEERLSFLSKVLELSNSNSNSNSNIRRFFVVDFESISSRFRVDFESFLSDKSDFVDFDPRFRFCRFGFFAQVELFKRLPRERAFRAFPNSICRFFLLRKSFGSFCSAKIRGIIWITPTLCIQLHTIILYQSISYYVRIIHISSIAYWCFRVLHLPSWMRCYQDELPALAKSAVVVSFQKDKAIIKQGDEGHDRDRSRTSLMTR